MALCIVVVSIYATQIIVLRQLFGDCFALLHKARNDGKGFRLPENTSFQKNIPHLNNAEYRLFGWGGRIRTFACWDQNPVS